VRNLVKYVVSGWIILFLLTGCGHEKDNNLPPIAKDDYFKVEANITTSLNILSNDYDSDGSLDLNSLEVVKHPLHGTLYIDKNKSEVQYTSLSNFMGEDYFIYRIADNKGLYSQNAKVTLTVQVPNQPPLALDDTYIVEAGSENIFNILSNDKDPDGTLNVSSIELGKHSLHGKITFNRKTGEVLYEAEKNYRGGDSFSYRVYDNLNSISNEAIVNITIKNVARKQRKREEKAERWYMQFSIENLATHQKFTGAKVGEMRSEEEARHHSLTSFNSVGYPYLNIVCNEKKRNFTVLYQAFLQKVDEKRWRFEVQTSDKEATLVLHWQGLYILSPYMDRTGRIRYNISYSLKNPLLSYMKLKDLKTGEEIAAIDRRTGLFNTYRFNMDGNTSRVFEWIVSSSYVGKIKKSVVEKESAKSVYKGTKVIKKKFFDLHHPPILKDQDG